MDERQNRLLSIFVENTHTIKKGFVWQSSVTKRLAAMLYAMQGKHIDCDAIMNARELLKESTSIFSYFRGSSEMNIATLLSLSENGEALIKRTVEIYDELKKYKLHASEFLVVAAYQIAACTGNCDFTKYCERTFEFYKGMRSAHPFLIWHEDYIYSAMLSLSDIEVSKQLEVIEQYYEKLTPFFYTSDAVHALAQIITIGNDCASSSEKVIYLNQLFQNRKQKLDRNTTLPFLGMLGLIKYDPENIADDVVYMYEYLRKQKGFGSLNITKQELLMLCCTFIAFTYKENANANMMTDVFPVLAVNLIIAHQLAVASATVASPN